MSTAIDPTIRDLKDCDCCDGLATSTPVDIANRPGLSAIAYRVGTHAAFKESMLTALSDRHRRALGAFNTRDDDDLSIALIDAWATVADVLGFYQERIANESYLRTATERRSVLELVRTIGYELGPGVAASTWLAFTLESPNGAPRSATGIPPVVMIPGGTRAQSIPGQEELPQTFETLEAIEGRPEWNALKPRASRPMNLSPKATTLYLKGTTTGLREGDMVLIVAGTQWDCRPVKNVMVVSSDDPASGYTEITLEPRLGAAPASPAPIGSESGVYALRQRAALFGANAPDWKGLPVQSKNTYLGITPDTSVGSEIEWPEFTIASVNGGPSLGLRGEYFNTTDFKDLKLIRIDSRIDFTWPGSPDARMNADNFSVRWTGAIEPRVSGTYTFRSTSDDGVRLWVNGQLLINKWQSQEPTSFENTINLEQGKLYELKLEYYEGEGGALIRLEWTPPGGSREIIPTIQLYSQFPRPQSYPHYLHQIHLDALYPKIFAMSLVVLSTPEERELYLVKEVAESSRTRFTLNARTTRLALSGKNLLEKFNDRLRETTVYAVSEKLDLAGVPITSDVTGELIELEGAVEGLRKGQLLAFTGLDDTTGNILSEVAMIDKVEVADTTTTIKLAYSIVSKFHRATLTINANVAPATHGETKTEVLGSGDASRVFQRFTLRQKPLTYVSADTATGGASTLQVRVNGVLWEEVRTLYGHGPREHIYITRADDEGNTAVIFGDGRTGARLPSGTENVTALYRVGIGKEGEVDADQIALLMTRPLGVRSVVNPLEASGAADPQAIGDSRENAPRTVLTLERIVSLRDFEDFARGFSGIGKALATWTWNRTGRGVLITVAGADGALVPEGSRLHRNLLAAIAKAGDPYIPVQVKPHKSATFTIKGRVVIDPLHLLESVSKEIERALRSRFSFAARSFGQPVDLGEVIATIQGVPGVTFVDIDQIARGNPLDTTTPLAAGFPRPGSLSTVDAAELLTLDAAPLAQLEVTR